jgi:hypothetical protein
VLFLQPARAGRAKRALRLALGGNKFELLVGFLTFVRSAHYWTLMHPDLAPEVASTMAKSNHARDVAVGAPHSVEGRALQNCSLGR